MEVEFLTDMGILDLYWSRSESAITETALKYGSYCSTIALNILRNNEDSEECVNDAYLNAWNAIPPQRPAVLSSFLGRIVRNLSLDKYKSRKAEKRSGDETALLLSELQDCVPSIYSVVDEVEAKVLEKIIDSFLSQIEKPDRVFFMRRYWYADQISLISERFAISESRVKTSLYRTRKKLKITLEKEGFVV